ncbi:MAG: hypothetical protein QG633_322 [Patescibacteria group bacterium]|jgi:hypothetical protein|nr:hypothetical protein [Patescibacteria group bacterium]
MHGELTTHNPQLITKTLVFLLLVVGCWSAVPPSAHAYTFSRDLKLGDSGEDVRALQISLNADAQTRIAASGVGSSGQETDFFGEKTQLAVIRYQNLHADEILKPLGLATGTGFVGTATRNSLSGAVVTGDTTKKSFSEAVAAFDAAIEASLPKKNDSVASVEDGDVRNEQSKELFLDAVRSSLVTSGASEEDIEVIENSIEDQSKKPITGLVDEFIEGRSQFDTATRTVEQIKRDVETIAPIAQMGSEKQLTRLFQWFNNLNPATPPKAHAQLLQPVGGMVLYTYLCTCSYTWLIMLGLPTIGLIDYEIGTQGFASYNLPYARYLMGLSTRIPVCYMYAGTSCVPIVSTYGLLTPIVGSSSF